MDELSTILEAILENDISTGKKISDISFVVEAILEQQGKSLKSMKELELPIEALIVSNQNSNKNIKNVVSEIKKLINKKVPVLSMKNLENSVSTLISEVKNGKINTGKIETLLEKISNKKGEKTDLTPVVRGLGDIKKAVENIETPEIKVQNDNTEVLREIADDIRGVLEKDNKTDQSEVIKLLKKIANRKEVTHFAGGGSVEVKNKSGVQINPSTEDGQDEIVTAINNVGLSIDNAIDQTAFDLNAGAFSATTNVSNDYVLDNIELNFSTTESKTITITSSDGTILFGGTVDTSTSNLGRNTTKQNFSLQFDKAFNGGDNITVAVTQTTGACLMDCVVKIRQGNQTLTGNPVLGAGNNNIGNVDVVVPGVPVTGRKTVATAGTAEVLKTNSTLDVGITVIALKGNTNNVFIGDSSVNKDTNKQIELEPGEGFSFAVNNTNLIYVDVTTDGEGVQFGGS